jgi:hypothetical protein
MSFEAKDCSQRVVFQREGSQPCPKSKPKVTFYPQSTDSHACDSVACHDCLKTANGTFTLPESTSAFTPNPLTTEKGVKEYMMQTTDAADWEKRVDAVRALHDGRLPYFWGPTILGLAKNRADVFISTSVYERLKRNGVLT